MGIYFVWIKSSSYFGALHLCVGCAWAHASECIYHRHAVNVFPQQSWYNSNSNSQMCIEAISQCLVFLIHKDDGFNWHQEILHLFNLEDSLWAKVSQRKHPIFVVSLQRPIQHSGLKNGRANMQCCFYSCTQINQCVCPFPLGVLLSTRRTKDTRCMSTWTNQALCIHNPFLPHVSVSVNCTWLRRPSERSPAVLWGPIHDWVPYYA